MDAGRRGFARRRFCRFGVQGLLRAVLPGFEVMMFDSLSDRLGGYSTSFVGAVR
jgi:hypothetical protein